MSRTPHTLETTIAKGRRFSEKARSVTNTVLHTLVWFFAAAVFLQNLFLQHQNGQLKELQSTMVSKDAYLQRITSQIGVGQRLRAISGATLDGRFREVALTSDPSRGSLVITFSPGCLMCINNEKGWVALASELRSQGWRVIWLSRDPRDVTLQFCQSHGIDMTDVLADPTHRTYEQLALAAVPNTIAIDPRGTIAQIWRGRLEEATFAYFHLVPPPSLSLGRGAETHLTPER
jgi:peroxiredoxin